MHPIPYSLSFSHAFKCIQSCLQICVARVLKLIPSLRKLIQDTYLYSDRRLRDLILVGGHLSIDWHADLAKDLIVYFVSLLLVVRILHHIESIAHHFLLQAHFFRFFSKISHNLVHRLWVHLAIHLGHNVVDPFQTFHHLRVHLGLSKHVHYPVHLTCHGVVHVDLFSRADQVFWHELRWPMLILRGQVLDLL